MSHGQAGGSAVAHRRFGARVEPSSIARPASAAYLGGVLLLGIVLGDQAAVAAPAFRVTLVEGKVERLPRPEGPQLKGARGAARRPGGPEAAPSAPEPAWRSVRLGTTLRAGDTLRTGPDGRVELTGADGSVVRLDANGRLGIQRARFSDPSRSGVARQVSLRLAIGRLWASVVSAIGGKASFEVRTSNAIAGVRGTSFAVLAREDLSALVRVYAGTVGVRGSSSGGSNYATRARQQVPGPTRVSQAEWEEVIAAAMTEVKISSLGEISPAERFEDHGADLEWARWNQGRDRR